MRFLMALPLRAMILGSVMSLVINTVLTYALLVKGTVDWPGDFITAGAIFLLFLLVVFLNTPLKLLKKEWALSAQELVFIYIMMIVASAIPTSGVTAQLIPFLSGVFYYATLENNWSELIHPYMKTWLAPQDPLAITCFYEGLPKGANIPWQAWTIPLLAWGSFMVALYLMMISMMVLIHRQWENNERLVYPLVQLPMDMVQEDSKGSPINPFLKNPLTWLGFAIPFVLLSTQGLNFYFPFIPAIKLYTYLPIFHGLQGVGYSQDNLFIYLRFTIIGLTYFLSLEVSFSLWFFYLFNYLQLGIFNRIGYYIEGIQELHTEGSIATAHQGMGAMIALVLVGVWTARKHLGQVFLEVFTKRSRIDDSEEMVPYRTAVWILIGASLYAALWLNRAGLPLPVALVLLFVAFAVFIGLTRIVAEGGIGYGRAQMTPQAFTLHVFGTGPIGPEGLVNLGMAYGWAGDIRTSVMTSTANGLKLADMTKSRKPPLFWAMLLAVLVGLFGSAWLVITIAYTYGGINLHYWFYGYMCRWAFSDVVANQLNPVPAWNILGPRGMFTAIGAGTMFILMYLRHRFLWWPVHYIGFPIGGTYVMFFAWFSMLLGWLLKLVILKYGGTKLYRTLRPFFLGMVLGQIGCAGFWMLVDFITGMRGNSIHV